MVLKRWCFPALVIWTVLALYPESRGEIYRYVDSEGVAHYSDVRWNKSYAKTGISGRVADRNGPGPGKLSLSPAPLPPEAVGGTPPPPLESASSDSLKSKSSRNLTDGTPAPSTDYSEYIENISRKYGLHPNLIWAVIKAESNFNPLAISRKGARGLMQLMPATARSHRVDNPFDPYQNIEGGARHLSNLLSHYRGDLTLALAAYNAGKEKVKQHGGVPPYRETRDYLQRVAKYLKGSGLFTADMKGTQVAMPKAEEKIYRYTSPDGVTLFTDIPR